MARNQLRPQLTLLRRALDFAASGGDARAFYRQPISDRDGGTWVRSPAPAPDPQLQHEVTTLLSALVEGAQHDDVAVSLRFSVKRHQGRVVVMRSGSPRDLFLYHLLRLLSEVGVDRLRKCPECGAPFLKVTRKEFCSTRCQARVNARNYRKQQSAKNRKGRRHGKTTRKG